MLFYRLASIVGLLTLGCGSDDDSGPANQQHGQSGRLSEYAPPGGLGKFPVGFVTLPFVDENRPELATVDAADHRTLPSVVWFPASEASRAEPKATFRDFFSPASPARSAHWRRPDFSTPPRTA